MSFMKNFAVIFVSLFLARNALLFASSSIVWKENFDTTTVDSLPTGWTSSRNEKNDASVSAGVAFSSPNALLFNGSLKDQWVLSYLTKLLKSSKYALHFSDRRSSTFLSKIIIEISGDNGNTFRCIGDTLNPIVFNKYVQQEILFSSDSIASDLVRIKWHLLGTAGSKSGTYRLDDISISSMNENRCFIRSLSITPEHPAESEPVTMQGVMVNQMPDTLYDVHFYITDSAGCGKVKQSQIIYLNVNATIPSRDSIRFEKTFVPSAGGRHIIKCAINLDGQDDDNDMESSLEYFVQMNFNSIVVNEIMFDPLPAKSEYIEFFNASTIPVSLDSYELLIGSRDTFLLPSGYAISQNGYFVIAADSELIKDYHSQITNYIILNRASLSLNNTGDVIVLHDESSRTIDSVCYSPSWHHPDNKITKGISLERKNIHQQSNDPSNWSSSNDISGGTPGVRNSIDVKYFPAKSSLRVEPNPFSPDGDGKDDIISIYFEIPAQTATVSIKIFDSLGRLVRSLLSSGCIPSNYNGIWDGKNDSGKICNTGLYILFVEASDTITGKTYREKTAIVLAKRQ